MFEFDLVVNNNVYQQIVTSVLGSHSTGPDGISPSNIKMLATSLTPILTLLYNYCLEHTIFPIAWKRSYIKSLSKVNLPKSPSDMRPIANLCEMSKVFEK